MGVDIGSSSSVWHEWFLLRVSTNLPDSFKFPITLFSYCLVMMMLMIELHWTYASYCVLIILYIFSSHGQDYIIHTKGLMHVSTTCKSLFSSFLPSSHTNLIPSVYCHYR